MKHAAKAPANTRRLLLRCEQRLRTVFNEVLFATKVPAFVGVFLLWMSLSSNLYESRQSLLCPMGKFNDLRPSNPNAHISLFFIGIWEMAISLKTNYRQKKLKIYTTLISNKKKITNTFSMVSKLTNEIISQLDQILFAHCLVEDNILRILQPQIWLLLIKIISQTLFQAAGHWSIFFSF